jgi:dTDP-4-amino-4,6-dideoxygalactose transaminase
MACFSFHPRKVISTGEGGMVTTDSADQARRLRRLRQHGMSVPDTVRHSARQVIIEEYDELGYNYRLTDIQAAIGIEQLKRLGGIVARRRELAARYDRELAGLAWLRTPHVPEWAEPNYQSYAVTLTGEAPIGRNALMQRLLDAGVATRRGIMLAHREPAYAELGQRFHLPNSEWASENSLLLPLYPQMTTVDQDEVIGALFALVHTA